MGADLCPHQCRKQTYALVKFNLLPRGTTRGSTITRQGEVGKCPGGYMVTCGYIRNLRRSPSWELRTASPRGRYGERYTHATMLRGVQAKFPQEASTCQRYHLAQGVAPVEVDAVSDIIPFGQKPKLHTLLTC